MSGEISNFAGWSVVEASRRVPHLLDHLANGGLLAWGCLGNLGQKSTPLSPSTWAGKIKLATSLTLGKPQAVGPEDNIFNLRIFPVLLAPNVVEHLGNFSLKDAFCRYVIGDPEVQHLGSIASAKVPHLLDLYRKGMCYSGHYWPLSTENLLLIGEPDPVGHYFGYYPTTESDLAQVVLRNRYEAMLNLLRSRRLTAEGDPTRPNDPQTIRSTIWESPSFYFDNRTGDVLEDRDWGDEEIQTFRSDDRREHYVLRWRAVLLRPATELVKQGGEDNPRLGTASKNRKMTPTEKFECCFEYVKAEMKLSPTLRPKIKKLIWRDAREHCNANISWPMFKDAWARAKGAVPAAASAWEKAGRSSKSGQK